VPVAFRKWDFRHQSRATCRGGYTAFKWELHVRANTVVHLQKKSVINWTWLRLSISHWSIVMIDAGGLLLVVPTYMQFQSQFYWWGCQNKTAKLRHLILLSRLTYWAPVEMLSQSIKWCKALWNTKCLHAWAFHFLNCIVMAFSTLWYPIGTHWIPISFHGKTIF
jgi:hypothetical protein